MESPNILAELRSKLILLSDEWRHIAEIYDANDEQQRSGARTVVVAKARQVFTSFGQLAIEIIKALGRDRFPEKVPDPPQFSFNTFDRQQSAFGAKDPGEAGQLAILWGAATQQSWSLGVRHGFNVLVEKWVVSLVYSSSGGVNGEWRVYQDVIPLALLAFDKLAVASQATPDAQRNEQAAAGPLLYVGQVDLKGERFGRLFRRFMDGSERFPYLRYIAASGQKTCPEWPDVPYAAGYNKLGLRKKDWFDLTNKRPGTFFVGLNEHWLEIEGQLWHAAFYFDGQIADQHDHDALQQQSAEIQGAIEQFERLATEAAGFLGNLPEVHPGVHTPRKPELWHRWLEAVCAPVQVQPARYRPFDVRRIPHIFLASAMFLEQLKSSPDTPITHPLAPLNVNVCDLRPVLAAAEAFLAERRTADERGKFDDHGAFHILSVARRRLAEALAALNHADGLMGDDATMGAIKALLAIANDVRADSRAERIEAVIAELRKITAQNQEAAAVITSDVAELRERRAAELQQTQARKAMDGAAEQAYHIANIEAADPTAWERRIITFVESCRFAGHDAELGESIASFAASSNNIERYAAGIVRQAVEQPGNGTAAAAIAVAFRDGFIRDVRHALEGIFDRATQPRRESAKIETADASTPPQGNAVAPTAPASEAEEHEPPLLPAGYLGLRVDDDRRTIKRDGFVAVVNLQASALQWAIFKKLVANCDVPLAHEAIRGVWPKHGVEPDPSDGTVNDIISKLRGALKPLGITIASRRKVGRLLAELPNESNRRVAKKKRPKK